MTLQQPVRARLILRIRRRSRKFLPAQLACALFGTRVAVGELVADDTEQVRGTLGVVSGRVRRRLVPGKACDRHGFSQYRLAERCARPCGGIEAREWMERIVLDAGGRLRGSQKRA